MVMPRRVTLSDGAMKRLQEVMDSEGVDVSEAVIILSERHRQVASPSRPLPPPQPGFKDLSALL